MTKRAVAAVAAVVFSLVAFSGLRAAEPPAPEHVLGPKDAPVTLTEYASLTCTHCAEFTTTILPELEKRYIEKGKLKYVFHDFPLDGVALKASALARCMPEGQYFPFLNALFKNQAQWAFGKNPDQTIVQYAKVGGLAEERAKDCIQNTNMLDTLVAERSAAQKKYDIDATPTFVFNEGREKLVGAKKLEEFTAVIDRLLDEKNGKNEKNGKK